MGLKSYNAKHFERVYAFWGKFPLVYEAQDWFTMLGSQWRIRKAVVDMLGDVSGKKVLDLGCGTGTNFADLCAAVNSNGNLIAVDVHPAMLNAARVEASRSGFGNVQIIESSMTKLPFDDNSFDAVFAMMSLSVVDEPDRALAEIARVTKSGGRFVVSDGRVFGKASLGRIFNPLLEHVYAPLGAWFPKRDFTDVGPDWEHIETREYVGGGFYAVSFDKLR